EERTLLSQQLLASYRSHPPKIWTTEDTIQSITALIQMKAYAFDEHKITDHLTDQMQEAANIVREQIQTHLQGKEGSRICNAILQAFMPEAKPQSWNCQDKYPYCVSADGKYALNANIFELLIDQNSLTGLPSNILNLSEFSKHFSNKNYPCTKINQ